MTEYYKKINWKDGADGGTPLSAKNLNKMEEGISGAEMRAGSLEYNKETSGLATEGNIAGAKGYKITAITANTLTLDLGKITNLEYAIGEKIYIRNGSTHALGEIEEINNNEIKYKLWVSLTFRSEVTINESYIYSLDNPNIGEIVIGTDAFALGKESKALGENSFAIGENSIAAGFHSIAFGKETLASFCSFALGKGAQAIGDNSVAIGELSQAIGRSSVAIGKQAKAIGEGSFSSSYVNTEGEYGSIGKYSHTEGANTLTKGNQAHAEGSGTTANGDNSHAEGAGTTVTASNGHAEGNKTLVSGVAGHAEGQSTQANGNYSHAGGYGVLAKGIYSFAHGKDAHAYAESAIALGLKSRASSPYQTVVGSNNIEDKDNAFIFIVGNGTDIRSNALTVDWNGNLKVSGTIIDGGGNVLSNNTWVPVQIDNKTYYFFTDLTWEDNAGYCNFIIDVGGYTAFKGKALYPLIITDDGMETLGDAVTMNEKPIKGQAYKTA